MKLNLQKMVQKLRTPRGTLLLLGAAIALLVVVALLVVGPGQGEPAPAPPAQSAVQPAPAPLSGPSALPTGPGLLQLDEFQVTVPEGWERRQDLEDDGPGTKLMLFGPQTGDNQLFIGVDVYPLRPGTTLKQFADQYASRNLEGRAVYEKQATLSGVPARMFGLVEDGRDKFYLVAVRGERGYVIGMIGPSGQSVTNNKAFREVVDTFMFYDGE